MATTPIPASQDTFTDLVPKDVVLDTKFKNQAVNAPANGTPPVFAVVFAPQDEQKAWIPNKEKLYRFEDDASVEDKVLQTLASSLIAMQVSAKVSLAHPYVKRFLAYVKAKYGVEITEDMTLSDAAILLKPIMEKLGEEQAAAAAAARAKAQTPPPSALPSPTPTSPTPTSPTPTSPTPTSPTPTSPTPTSPTPGTS